MTSTRQMDYSDLAITISFRCDSADRLRNIRWVLEHYAQCLPGVQIVVVEQLTGPPAAHLPATLFVGLPDCGRHYKTFNLNEAIRWSDRQFLMMCDADVVVYPAAVEAGMQLLRGGASFVRPHNGLAIALSRELGVQFARNGVRVNALCPGPVDTPLLQELYAHDPEAAARRMVHVPMGRFARAREIANAVLFLASDESSFITASDFLVDGGIAGAYVTPL